MLKKKSTINFSIADYIGLLSAAIMLGAFLIMPWVTTSPDETLTGFNLLSESHPEILSGVLGLFLVPLSGLLAAALLFGGLFSTTIKRYAPMGIVFAGIIGIIYYAVFLGHKCIAPLSTGYSLGAGFGIALLATIGLILQGVIPRISAGEVGSYQLSLAKKKVLWAYIFLAIPIVFFSYIRLYPTYCAFQMSLYDYNPLAAEQEYVGLENYERVFEDINKERRTETRAAFENTVSYVALGMPIQLLLALGIALMLNEIRFLSMVYRLLFFLPFVTSTIAVAWVFRMLYQPQFGFINVLLKIFSLPEQPFLKHPSQALVSIVVVVIWQGLGYAVIIFLAGLKQISRTYYEAAEVDGATSWQTFRNITLPLLQPSIVYLLVLQTIAFLRMFAPVLAMSSQGDGGPLKSTTTVVLRVYREAFQSFDMGYAASLTVILFALILIITIIQLAISSRTSIS